MAVDIGPRIGIDGEKEFRQNLANINQQLRTLGSEMQAVTSQFDANDRSQEALAAQTNVLNRQIDAQQQKLQQLQHGLEESTRLYGENDTRTLRWAQAVNEAQAGLNRMQTQLGTLNGDLDDTSDSLDEAADASEGLGGKFSSLTVAAGNLISSGIEALISSVGNMVSTIWNMDEATEEFRSAMAKLDSAYEYAGMSADGAREAYYGFYEILGDTDTAVEASQLLAQIVDNKELLNMTDYKPGKRVKCTVMSADDNGITISLGGKKDGFISKEEACYEGEYNPADFKPGSEIEAVILSNTHDSVLLSKKKIDAKRIEDEEAEKALKADVFTLEMTEVVKGGLRGRMGSYTVFVPASHITTKYVSNLEDYKGKKLRLVVMPPKAKEGQAENTEEAQDKPQKKSKYIFASQRLVLEREKKEKEDAFWESIHVHDIVEGKVKRFTEFGAFVSVRGFDCLCHISEISWNKITDPSTVLKAGETYDFVVLKMDREANKISLGYKQLQKKPYEEAAEKYPVGTVIKGKVERIFPYGAFVSIDNGVDGLVHVSQIAHQYIKDANEVLTVGQEVEAKIIGFEGNRITLSIKALLPEPEVREEGGAEEKKAKKTDGDKKEKKAKKTEKTDELREWHSDNSSATLGDLFKAFDLGIEEEAPAAPKKTRKKASTEEAPAEETPSDDKKD